MNSDPWVLVVIEFEGLLSIPYLLSLANLLWVRTMVGRWYLLHIS